MYKFHAQYGLIVMLNDFKLSQQHQYSSPVILLQHFCFWLLRVLRGIAPVSTVDQEIPLSLKVTWIEIER